MTKLLNIDELTTVEKEIQIKGERYPVVERTVEQVLQAIKAEKTLSSQDVDSEESRVEMFVGMVKSAIPECPDEVLRNLPIRSLTVILEFINANEQVEEPSTGK